MRILIAVTHLLGAGHLTRAAAIARALGSAGCDVTLVSGGRPTPLVSTRDVTLVQLPPVQARVADFATLRDLAGEPVGPDLLAARRDLLLATLADTAPDAVVTELYPFGRRALAAEFRALVEAAHAARPRPLIAASVRDILACPIPTKIEAAHAVLRDRYDAILAHADPALAPIEASWPMAADLARRVVYTGYIDANEGEGDAPLSPGDGSILVSGGSSAAALPLYRAALQAARLTPERPWRILVGHGVSADDHAALAAEASERVRVERSRPDFDNLLRSAALFVGQAGYNTVVDLLRAGAPAVLVPFEAGGETEQRLRADRLAELGLASVAREADLSGETLARLVRERLAAPRPGPAAFRLDGAAETVRALVRLADGRTRRP